MYWKKTISFVFPECLPRSLRGFSQWTLDNFGRHELYKGSTSTKTSLNFCFVNFLAAYESKNKSFAHFSINLFKQIMKTTLTQFYDNF